MKYGLILTGSFLAIALSANEVQLSRQVKILAVDISTARVKLSGADYSTPLVKVLVPLLADVTLLNHRNEGEGAPCLATTDTMFPEDVIKNNPALENHKFVITLTKVAELDEQHDCQVTLHEDIESNIRGFKFKHHRSIVVGTRHQDDCR